MLRPYNIISRMTKIVLRRISPNYVPWEAEKLRFPAERTQRKMRAENLMQH